MPQKYKVLPGKKPIAGPRAKAGPGSIPALGSGPKFTPGPWKVIKPGHGLASPYLCVELDEEQQYATLEMLPADAHLIAAAPDLLEALQLLLVGCDCCDYGEVGIDNPRPITHTNGNKCPVCTANAAIAKALGQNTQAEARDNGPVV